MLADGVDDRCPVVSDSGDGDAVTLGLRFTSSVDGYVKGLAVLP